MLVNSVAASPASVAPVAPLETGFSDAALGGPLPAKQLSPTMTPRTGTWEANAWAGAAAAWCQAGAPAEKNTPDGPCPGPGAKCMGGGYMVGYGGMGA